ncbi:unnamed protein product [Vitrella brassicaformis CCMP3155]|uniref:LCCL domain-containing protein n=1 Tax=Vitrella brassicaformis (strain CCMP3155) TaxID=1169540 RepID=A0A0G4EGG3_VITBC|nr:unnamed protein product [Vitrella brassicaformis CCMP3155]|eukprot:CEL94494.1 unnamed protein product [Vitrella brassicaformis CCMP3155]
MQLALLLLIIITLLSCCAAEPTLLSLGGLCVSLPVSESGGFGDGVLVGERCETAMYEDTDNALFLISPPKIYGRGARCLGVSAADCLVLLEPCMATPSQQWTVADGQLMSLSHKLCATTTYQGGLVRLSRCDPHNHPSNGMSLRQVHLNTTTHEADRAAYLTAATAATLARFRQLSASIGPDTNKVLADVRTQQTWLESRLREQEGLSSEASRLLRQGEIISPAQAELREATEGTGVLAEVFDDVSCHGEPMAVIATPTLAFSQDTVAGRALSGPLCVRLSGFISAPRDGSWSLVAKGVRGGTLRLSVDGREVLKTSVTSATASPVTLHQHDKHQITAQMTSPTDALPTFTVYWSGVNTPEAEIPTENLFPDVIDEFCPPHTPPHTLTTTCTTTFDELASASGAHDKATELSVVCPSGCAGAAVNVYGGSDCYSMQSSVCLAAIHSGVLGERGGVATVHIDPTQTRPAFPEVSGFVVTSKPAAASRGCGHLTRKEPQEGAPARISDLTIQLMRDVLSASAGGGLSGWRGRLSTADSPDSPVALYKKDPSPQHVTDAMLVCGDGQPLPAGYTKESVAGVPFSLAVKRLTDAGAFLSDVALVMAAPNTSQVPLPTGWSRQVCDTAKGSVQLLTRHQTKTPTMQLPSASLSCTDTFEKLSPVLPTTIVSCPKHCQAASATARVFGLFEYSAPSSVCLAAIHAGVISDMGGNVAVHKSLALASLPAHVAHSAARNMIDATTPSLGGMPGSQQHAPLYFLEMPEGVRCLYATDTLLAHVDGRGGFVPGPSSTIAGGTSFIEIVPPAATQVPLVQATNPRQIEQVLRGGDDTSTPPQQQQQPQSPLMGYYYAPPVMPYSMPLAYPLLAQVAQPFTANTPPLKVPYYTTTTTTINQQQPQRSAPVVTPLTAHTPTTVDKTPSAHSLPPATDAAAPVHTRPSSSRFQQSTQTAQAKEAIQSFHALIQPGESAAASLESAAHALMARQQQLQSQYGQLSAQLKAAKASLSQTLKQREMDIRRAEERRAAAQADGDELTMHEPLYMERFDSGASDVHANWMIVDAADSLGGPSKWHFGSVNSLRALLQSAAKTSRESPVASAALLQGRSYPVGYVVADVAIASDAGSAGIVFKYKDDMNYLSALVHLPPSGASPSVELRSVAKGRPALLASKAVDVRPGRSIKLAVDFGKTNMRTFINGKLVLAAQLSSPPTGGGVGVAAFDKTHFTSFTAGCLCDQHLAPSGAFGSMGSAAGQTERETHQHDKAPKPAGESSTQHQHLSFRELGGAGIFRFLRVPRRGWRRDANDGHLTANQPHTQMLIKQAAQRPNSPMSLAGTMRLKRPEAQAGFFFSGEGRSRFYALTFSAQGPPTLTRTDGGSVEVIGERLEGASALAGQSMLKPFRWHRVAMSDNGQGIVSASIDDGVVCEWLVPPSAGGRVGLLQTAGQTDFKTVDVVAA